MPVRSITFNETNVRGVKLLEASKHEDERGWFHRLWCQTEFSAAGMDKNVVQISIAQTREKGTLRGMHFQRPPSVEDKIVSCIQGSIFDVALDLRPRSETFLQHFGFVLSASSPRAVLIPAGCAHGYLTLSEDCKVIYSMTDFYEPTLSSGVRYNDPCFAISWPEKPSRIAERDRDYPDSKPSSFEFFSEY